MTRMQGAGGNARDDVPGDRADPSGGNARDDVPDDPGRLTGRCNRAADGRREGDP